MTACAFTPLPRENEAIEAWPPGNRGISVRWKSESASGSLLSLRRAAFAKPAEFEPRYANREPVPPFDLAFEPFKERRLNFEDTAAFEARKMQMILLGSSFVIVTFAFVMHQIELINDPEFLKGSERPVHRGEIEAWQAFPSKFEDFGCVEVLAGALKHFGDHAPLLRQTEPVGPKLGRNMPAPFEMRCKNHSSCKLIASRLSQG